MNTNSTDPSPASHWSALLPIWMSLAAFTLVLGYLALHGAEPHEDEGLAARIYQMLMTFQLPIVAYFAIKWLPRKPAKALLVLAAQAAAWLTALGVILILERNLGS